MFNNIVLIISSVSFNAIAQIFLKKGMMSVVKGKIIDVILSVACNSSIWFGLGCFGISLVLWLYILTKVSVSIAYPMNSIGYIITVLLAYFILKEQITVQKIAGVFVICLGVFILSWNSGE